MVVIVFISHVLEPIAATGLMRQTRQADAAVAAAGL